MGANYYLHRRGEPKPPCEACGRPYEEPEPLHIGKSSAGWCFALHVEPEEGINDLEDWRRLWSEPGAEIYDEYGDAVTPAQMLEEITDREWALSHHRPADWYNQNYAQPGPSGLARRRIGKHCLKHGAGTWDCMVGWFR